MSGITAADAAQPTKNRESAESFISRAPTAIGSGKDAVKRAAVILVHQLRDDSELKEAIYRSDRLDTSKVWKALTAHWLPRCSTPLTDDELHDAIEEAISEIEADKIERRLEAEHEAAAAADAADDDDDRETKANQLRQKLNCSLRWAYTLLEQGHTSRAVCEKIAVVNGGHWTDYKRPTNRRGRRIDLVEYQMRPYVDGFSFRDFVTDPPSSVQGAAREFCHAFKAAYEEGADYPDHIDRQESVTDFAKDRVLESDAALLAWGHYKAWRLMRVAEWLNNEAQVMERAAGLDSDLDFG
jgi:hypothetical protein